MTISHDSPSQPTRILVIRHAATRWNAEKRLQGRTDIPLSPAGAADLKGKGIPADFIRADWFCSPLTRTRQTAERLGITSPTIENDLIEMHWGDWEGQRLPDLRAELGEQMRQMEAQGLDLHPPGGESPRQVRARMVAWLERHRQHRTLGIISHKGVIRALLSEALQWDMKSDCPVKVDWSGGFEFALSRGRLTLKAYNIDLRG